MLAFYGRRLSNAVVALMHGTDRLFTAIALIATVVIAVNGKIANAVSNWHGFSGWYAVIVPGLLVLYALAHGHYERETKREERLAAIENAIAQIQTQSAGGITQASVGGTGNMFGTMVQQIGVGNIPTVKRK